MADNYKPSKEFTDQAWSDMKALLDKDMPEKGAIVLAPNQEKRNRFLLLLPLFLLIAALFSYYQFKGDLSENFKTSAKETTELAIVSKDVNSSTESVVTLEELSAKSIAESNQPSTNSSNTVRPENTILDSRNNTATSNNTAQFSKSDAEKLIVGTKEAKDAILVNTPNTRDLQILIDEERSVAPISEPVKEVIEVEEEKPKPVILLAPIRAKVLNTLAFNEEKPSLEKFLNIQELKSKLPIFAFIGARNYDFSDNINFVVKMETVLRKRNKKLGWRTGVNYAQRSTTYLTKDETIARINTDDNPVDASGNGNIESGTENVVDFAADYYQDRAELNSNPIKYHFLEIPVLLDYKISKKWSIHTGLYGKTLIYSSSQNFGLLNKIRGRNQYDMAAIEVSEEFLDSDVNVSYFKPNNFNLGASLGLNFQTKERLGLQARFSQNLFDVYPELKGKQRSNSIELGLSWRLK